ncbi:MAG: phosphoglycerate dehydrogenase [Arcobacteraceae bacterium]|jgi:D-3-phosphoglycerate dehydrogenase|nr:phosphoglycerate dehydrogenase [Arcobacteraceae bacterium]
MNPKIVVTANAFSKNKFLVNELQKFTSNIVLNTSGRYAKENLIESLKDAQGAIVGLDKIDETILKECRNLKIVSKYGVGLDNINLEDCKKYNVQVGWTGGVNKTSVAEMTLGFMLMLMRNLYTTSNELKSGTWNKSGGFQLSGKTIGIIGVGHIGKEVVRLLQPFNCKILVNDIINQDEYYSQSGLMESTKDEIYKQSDIITIHTPLTGDTQDLITLKEIRIMKKSAFVINTARGGIVNENDFKIALKEHIIAGGAIDPYVVEPPTDNEFISLPNLIATPHIGGNAREAVEAMGMSAIEHLRNYFKDKR